MPTRRILKSGWTDYFKKTFYPMQCRILKRSHYYIQKSKHHKSLYECRCSPVRNVGRLNVKTWDSESDQRKNHRARPNVDFTMRRTQGRLCGHSWLVPISPTCNSLRIRGRWIEESNLNKLPFRPILNIPPPWSFRPIKSLSNHTPKCAVINNSLRIW